MEPPSSSTCQHPAENSTSSSSGASSSTKNRVQRYCPRQKDIRFELECEWEDCTKVLDDMDAYLRHVDEHLNSACDLQCKWRLCDSDELETDDDLKRHVRFHAFHAKLKQIGVNVLKSLQERQNSSASANSSSKAPECTVDEHKRNSIPDVPLNFQCAWEKCDYSTDNIEFFYRHIRQQHVEVYQSGDKFPPKGMKCPWRDCEIFISSRFRLGVHIKTHSVEKAVACPNCGTLFSTFTKFLDHCNRSSKIKDNDLRYQCTICCKIFARNNLLKDHMRKHVNKFKCPICEMRCVDKYDLNKHILYKHSKMKPFKCNSCEYSCKTPQDLKKHISLIHTERDEYSCSQCEFKTKDINYYKRHLVKFHLCQNGEKSSSIMNETDESVLQYSSSYMCHVCNKIYSMGATLTRHLKDQHNIQWQSGYSRFRYKLEPDGYFRLQTVRYDSIELVEELNRQQQQKEQQQQQQYQEQIEREQLVDQLQLEQQHPQHFSHLESINEEMNGENSSGEIVGLIQLEEAATSDEPVDDTVVNTAFGQLISVIEEFVVTDSSPIQEVNADNTDTTSSSFQLSSTNTNTSDAIDLENIFSSSFNFSCLTKNSFDTIHY